MRRKNSSAKWTERERESFVEAEELFTSTLSLPQSFTPAGIYYLEKSTGRKSSNVNRERK